MVEWRYASAILALAGLVGCTGSAGESSGTDMLTDGGPPHEADGGDTAPRGGGVDGSEEPGPTCDLLREEVCGADMACKGIAECQLVEDWIARGNVQSCAALYESGAYVPCAENRCNMLRDLVCGPQADGGRPCAQTPACVNAISLAGGATYDAGTMHDSGWRAQACAQALQEPTAYPPCRP